MPKFREGWRNAWRIRTFREQLFTSLFGVLVALVLLRVFLEYMRTRHGIVLRDPLLPLFSPIDLKWITFSLLYSGMLLGLVSLCLYPFSLLLAARALVVMILLRIGCLFLLPLDPPADSIPLADPIIQSPLLGPAVPRDLFFSSQTGIMALLAFTAQWKDMKVLFSVAALVVSLLLLLQHVHYTIDVVAAPCFAYVSYALAKWLTVEEAPKLLGRSCGTALES